MLFSVFADSDKPCTCLQKQPVRKSNGRLGAADVARPGPKASRKGTDLHLVLNVVLKILEWTRRDVYLRGFHVSPEAADLFSGQLVKQEFYVLFFGSMCGGEG